jgi:hypothetical protein
MQLDRQLMMVFPRFQVYSLKTEELMQLWARNLARIGTSLTIANF